MTVRSRCAMVRIVLEANSLAPHLVLTRAKEETDSLSDSFADKLIGRIVDARSGLTSSHVRLRPYRMPTRTRTSSMTNTLERFRIALAMQRSCFSLCLQA